jgi:acyl-coenzyme A synthetase/AMP-(fatty) acid ligase
VVARPSDGPFDDVVAVVVPREPAAVTLDALRGACAGALHSAFAPTHLVSVSALPRTSMGKIDRRALAAMANAADPVSPARMAGPD